MFLVPGPEAAYEDVQPVPHGEVRAVWYESKTLGGPRRMHVYTPPGYERGNSKYPVLYLIHGGGDEDSGWSITAAQDSSSTTCWRPERSSP
ncbi:MAG TPA: hypothetical protein VMH81_23290 [Bryobacteraceae bacterium]|nr:hypothetical protein [Bryobacteraceae bacterium]